MISNIRNSQILGSLASHDLSPSRMKPSCQLVTVVAVGVSWCQSNVQRVSLRLRVLTQPTCQDRVVCTRGDTHSSLHLVAPGTPRSRPCLDLTTSRCSLANITRSTPSTRSIRPQVSKCRLLRTSRVRTPIKTPSSNGLTPRILGNYLVTKRSTAIPQGIVTRTHGLLGSYQG